jgi:hypothetical protein
MRLFVFCIEELVKPLPTLLQMNAKVFRVKTLLGGGHALWEDNDPEVEDNEEYIRKNYLEPNNIPVESMGRIPGAEPLYWVSVDGARLKFEDFYTYEEAIEGNIFTEDPYALCWKQFLIFTDGSTGADIIGSTGYLGIIAEPMKYIMETFINKRVGSV